MLLPLRRNAGTTGYVADAVRALPEFNPGF